MNHDSMDPQKFSKAIKPICSTILDLPPSCIEFVPGYNQWFVVGTYNLQKDIDTGSQPQSRTGSLNLSSIIGNELTLVQTLDYPSAILDLHFFPGTPIFAVVSSTGTISVYNFRRQNLDYYIEHVATHQAFDPAILILSFAWYPYHGKANEPLLAVTLSNGSVHLLRFRDWNFIYLDILNDSEHLNSHTLEAWCCAFAPIQGEAATCIYSGGDDAKLRLVTLESLPIAADSKLEILDSGTQTVFKGHDAGVTAILPLPMQTSHLGCLLLTGSYDDHVRVYTTYDFRSDAPNTTGKALAELKIGGGVWRLKLLQDYPLQEIASPDAEVTFRVLASCMHAGARILEVKGSKFGEWSIEVLGSVTIHGSMCYGSDLQPIDTGERGLDGEILCVSTSFYDRLLCVWRFDPRAV